MLQKTAEAAALRRGVAAQLSEVLQVAQEAPASPPLSGLGQFAPL